eukprot:jgi/Astpho2/2164/fgenesh1_pg.00040_%23_20_t
MSKLVLALVLGLGSHLVAGQPAATAQTLGGVSISKSLGDLVSEDVLPENDSVPAMRVALRLIGPQAWPVTDKLYAALHQVAQQLCGSHVMEATFTIMPSPLAVTHGFSAQQLMNYAKAECTAACNDEVFPDLVSAAGCRECGLNTKLFTNEEYASVDVAVIGNYTRRSMLIGTTQATLGVSAFQVAYRLLPGAAPWQPFGPLDPVALRMEAWKIQIAVRGDPLVPYGLQQENMLMLMLHQAKEKLQLRTVYFFRPAQTSQRNKESRVNMLVNRMAQSQARAQNEDPRLVRKEWEALLEEVTRETARMGLHDCSYRLLRVDAMEDEVLADQLDILAGVHRGSSTWSAGAPFWPAALALGCIAVGIFVGAVPLVPRIQQRPTTPIKGYPSVVAPFSSVGPAGERVIKHVPLRVGSVTLPSEIEICQTPDGKDWLLGSGANTKVYKGIKNGVQDVAVKVLANADETQLRYFEQEIKMMKQVSFDRNIVQFYGCCLQIQDCMLLTELMSGGDLMDAIAKDTVGDLRWDCNGASLAIDVVRGLCHLHSKNVVHMDLKSKNVLLNHDKTLAKIADVGLSRLINSSSHQQSSFQLGTFEYTAPELLTGKRCNEKVDIYSLGVVLWEIITHEPPRRGQMRECKVPEECSADILEMVDSCLQEEPHLRPSAKEVFMVLRDWHGGHKSALKRFREGKAMSRINNVRESTERPQRHSADHNQEDASHFDSGSYPASARRSQSDVSQYKAYDRAARQEQGAENSPAMYSSAGSAERLAGSSKDGMSGSDQPKQRSASGLRETGSGASVEEEQAGADAQQTDQAKPQHHATSMTPADLANYGPFANAAPFGDSDDE